jgi:hypothetical protein
MFYSIYNDAMAMDRGEITGGQYALRATGHVLGTALSVAVPFADEGVNWVREQIEEQIWE